MKEELIKLINQYKETEFAIEKYMVLLDEKKYAQGKLDIVKVIISDLEKVLKKFNVN